MFYHALTGNAGTEDLKPVLLWENSSPTAAFAAQTISLDLTDYAGVIIEYFKSATENNLRTRIYVKKTDTAKFGGGFKSDDTAIIGASGRNVTINDSGVEFTDAAAGWASTSVTTLNTDMIPYRIYGVKEYIVEASEWELGTFTSSATGAVKATLGYKPKKLLIIYAQSAGLQSSAAATIAVYDEEVSGESYQFITSTSETTLTLPNTTDDRLASIDNDGFTFNKSSVSGVVNRYVAIK